MSLMQLFQFFSSTRLTHGMLANQIAEHPPTPQESLSSWPEVERRSEPDRRQHERRLLHCQPYIDTRKNHGRRRSFGRRASDQMPSLPF